MSLLHGVQMYMQSLLLAEFTNVDALLHIDSTLCRIEQGSMGEVLLRNALKDFEDPTGWLFEDIANRLVHLIHGCAFKDHKLDEADGTRLSNLVRELDDLCHRSPQIRDQGGVLGHALGQES